MNKVEKAFLTNYHFIRILQQIFSTFSDFEKIQVFSEKEKPIHFFKNPNFESFEKSYYFSRILRQMCYNLVKKRERNWQNRVKKLSR